MSEENVEIVRRLYRAMEARDYEAASGLTAPSAPHPTEHIKP
jgi:hypothetical protein